MSGHQYIGSNSLFDDDVDDETFLRNSRRPGGSSFEEQAQTFAEQRKVIEDRTVKSTERSISLLRDSEQIGIATAEELARQREQLERTDKRLDEINATLRFSQKHINGIKSVFSSLKNYVSGKNDQQPKPLSSLNVTQEQPEDDVPQFNVYDNHPATRLRNDEGATAQAQASGSRDFSARLDANLQDMCYSISKLKGLATELTYEIDSQNDLIDTITNKTEQADITVGKQNKDMVKLLKK